MSENVDKIIDMLQRNHEAMRRDVTPYSEAIQTIEGLRDSLANMRIDILVMRKMWHPSKLEKSHAALREIATSEIPSSERGDELTAEQVNVVLQRFDETNVDLQRGIVSAFVQRAYRLEKENERLRTIAREALGMEDQ